MSNDRRPYRTLDALTDVTIDSPSDGDVLTYDAASGQWEAGAGSGDPNPTFASLHVTGASTLDGTTTINRTTELPGGADGQGATAAQVLFGTFDVDVGTTVNRLHQKQGHTYGDLYLYADQVLANGTVVPQSPSIYLMGRDATTDGVALTWRDFNVAGDFGDVFTDSSGFGDPFNWNSGGFLGFSRDNHDENTTYMKWECYSPAGDTFITLNSPASGVGINDWSPGAALYVNGDVLVNGHIAPLTPASVTDAGTLITALAALGLVHDGR